MPLALRHTAFVFSCPPFSLSSFITSYTSVSTSVELTRPLCCLAFNDLLNALNIIDKRIKMLVPLYVSNIGRFICLLLDSCESREEKSWRVRNDGSKEGRVFMVA